MDQRLLASIFMFATLAVRGFAQSPSPVNSKPTTAQSPVSAQPETDSEKIERLVEARSKRISAELQSLKRSELADDDWAKEWAGTYYDGDGLGMNVTIRIAPKAGLVYTWHGCMGLYDACVADIVHADKESVRVKFAALPKQDSMHFMSSTLYFVRWGDRKYLVPERRMENLIDNYKAGGHVRRSMVGIPRLTNGKAADELFAPEPAELPQLPREYAKRLNFRQVRLALVKLGPAQRQADVAECFSLKAEFDKGSADGMKANDILTYRQGKSYGFMQVSELHEHSCAGHLLYFRCGEPESNMPKVGMSLTHWVDATARK